MPLTVIHPQTRRRLIVGDRIRPKPHSRKLSLANYLGPSLPSPPPACDYSAKARKALADIYLNDRLGDCVVAGAAHMIGVWTGNATGGTPDKFEDGQIRAAYHWFSGGHYPNEDRGCDEEYALNFWAARGFEPQNNIYKHQIVAWVSVDASNLREVHTALWLFEGLMSGVELPAAWINPPPDGDGFVFDVAGDPDMRNGHCMTHFSYDANGIGCATWGMYGKVTNAALKAYFVPRANGALYAAISRDALERVSGKAANGFNLAQLVADAKAMGFDQV